MAGPAVPELIAELGQRVRALRPHPPAALYEEVSALAAGVGRLRRIAKVARDAAGDSVTDAPEIADTITFLASDRAAGITGAWLNVTAGMFAS